MRTLTCFFLTATLGAVSPAVAQPVAPVLQCKAHPDVVDTCYKTRGRLGIYNGTPGVRIWKVGTNRILGVMDFGTEVPLMPPELLYGLDAMVFADFLVCPFTKEKQGQMQRVCVQSAKNIRVEKTDPVTGEMKMTFIREAVELNMGAQ